MTTNVLRSSLALTAAALFACSAAGTSSPRCPAAEQCFTVTHTLDVGPGSLRQAILDANARPGRDRVLFDIPGAGPHVIVTGGLAVTAPIDLDGYSQPGSREATDRAPARLGVVLVASADARDGLVIAADDSTVAGLGLTGFREGAALTVAGRDNVVRGCHLGTVASDAPRGNRVGVELTGPRNVLGGTAPAHRNVIEASASYGVDVRDCPGCRVLGNHVLGNDVGVRLRGRGVVRVGGLEPGARNVISGGYDGVQIAGSGQVVEGNAIGTDVAGAAAGPTLANVVGVSIAAGARGNAVLHNVIANPLGHGVHVFGDDNRVEGNQLDTSHGLGILVRGRRNVVRSEGAPESTATLGSRPEA